MIFKLRDLREKFFQVDDEYLNGYAKLCGINATGIYMTLCRHASKDQSCFPSKKTIGEKLRISERSVYTAIKTLEKWNIIKVESQGRKHDGSYKSLTYFLLDKTQWKPKPTANIADGKKKHLSTANNDNNRRQQMPNNKTQYNNTHIKKRKEVERLRKKLIDKKIIKKDLHMERQVS